MKLRPDADQETGPDPSLAQFEQAQKGQAVAQDPELLKNAKEGLAAALALDRDNRKEAKEDLDFVAGKQWPDHIRKEREAEDRPVITANELPQFIKQVTGDIRRNRPSIQCTPGDGAASPETAQIYEGLIRSIERESGAQRVYSRAADHAARGGIGHFRLVVAPAGPMSLDRDLKIQSIRNAFSVLWGPCTEDDFSDAKECWVSAEMPKKEFEKQHPKAQPGSWMHEPGMMMSTTAVGAVVTLCEYWKVDETPVNLVEIVHDQAWVDPWGRMQPPTGAEALLEDPSPAELGFAITSGFRVARQGEGFKRTITQHLFAGDTLLKSTVWEGERIPIFTVIGEEVETGDKIVRHGLVRNAKDLQRLVNVSLSGDAESYGLAPKVPFIIADEQIEGFEDEWALANKKPRPYLRYNLLRAEDGSVIQAPKPQREQPVATNPATMAMAQNSSARMRSVIGIYDASLGGRSNETSGVAIEARDQQADTGTFVYVDNLMCAIEACGREIVALIPKIYSTRQWIRVLGKDDAAAIVELKSKGVDLSIGRYDVIVQTGPAHATARKEAAAAMMDLAKIVPPQFAIELIVRIAKLQDWQDADELGERFIQIATSLGLLPPPGAPGAPPSMPGAIPGAPGAPGAPPNAPGQMPGAPPMAPAGAPNIPGIALPPELLARIPLSPGGAPAAPRSAAPIGARA